MSDLNIHSQVIDILTQEVIDYKSIVISLGKKYPEILVEVAGRKTTAPQWYRDVVSMILSDRDRVLAVKLIREKMGLSLKEALDICNYLQRLLWTAGHIERDYEGCVNPQFSKVAQDLFDSSF